jgi:hypothetical protein
VLSGAGKQRYGGGKTIKDQVMAHIYDNPELQPGAYVARGRETNDEEGGAGLPAKDRGLKVAAAPKEPENTEQMPVSEEGPLNTVTVKKPVKQAVEEEKRQVLRDAIIEALQKEEEKKLRKKEEIPDTKEKLYVKNAGLVILHPFLSTYFTRCGLLDKGKFVSDEAQARAVHLLQYLVFETEQNQEQDLALNKLLCGMPFHQPVPAGIEVSEQEKKVSAELILAVLQQWDKMKNTSPAGFKATFLHREGVLQEEENAWVLRVEQKALDVLLQTLPWGLGLIKAMWMEKPLLIEWT